MRDKEQPWPHLITLVTKLFVRQSLAHSKLCIKQNYDNVGRKEKGPFLSGNYLLYFIGQEEAVLW
jgi:hypothetical protein